MRYRPDISGLRACAVVPVVLYHLNASLVPGGYVGVDVFFVISGYLITALILADLGARRFSLVTFYDRRIRRIVPAYALMALATALAALVILPPAQLVAFGESLKAASIFFANRYFLSATGYFDAGAEQLLLHTWSLSIEEQFYLAWPLLLVVVSHPRLVRFRGMLVWALLLLSLFAATRNAIRLPERAFYNAGGRFWELLMGAVLALNLLPPLRRQAVAEGIAALGLAMILAALALFNHDTLFPGATALLPTGGALLVLWAGEGGRTTYVGRLLAWTPLVGIGLISYSLYLWHWPVLAVYRYVTQATPGLTAGMVLLALMLALSVLSWRYVEAPFRRHGAADRRSEWRSIGVGLLALGSLVALSFLMTATRGLPQRADAGFHAAEAALAQHWRGTPQCLLGPRATTPPAACRFGAPAPDAPEVVLWGDSFANHHAPALDAIGRDAGFALRQITKAGCYPAAPEAPGGALAGVEATACNAFRAEAIQAVLADPKVDLVVIAGNWPRGPALAPAMDGLKRAVEELGGAGKRVLLVATPGDFSAGGGRCVVRTRFLGESDAGCNEPAASSAAAAAPLEQALTALAAGQPNVAVFLPRPLFCDAQVCRPTLNGLPVFTDGGHLNVGGSEHLIGPLRAAIAAQMAGAPAR